MPSLYSCCIHTGVAHHVLCRMCLHWGCTLADMLIDVAIGEVGPCDESDFHCEWAIHSGNANSGIDRWTFSPWGSPYRSSHWIGRSTSGLHPYCCHRGGMAVHAFSLSSWDWPLVNSFWINEWRKNSQNKSRKWLTAWRTIYNWGEPERAPHRRVWCKFSIYTRWMHDIVGRAWANVHGASCMCHQNVHVTESQAQNITQNVHTASQV